MSVACHDLRALLPDKLEQKRVVWVHRHDGRTDLVFLGRGLVRSSRTVPDETPEELVREIQRSLPLVQWRDCQALWITGDEAERFLSAPALAELGAAVSEPPYAPNIQTLVDTLPKEQRGAALVALAVAVGSSHPRINLLPPALRPRRVSRGQAITAFMLGLTVVLGLGFLGILLGDQRRALHDVIAGTVVVYSWDARAARLRFLSRESSPGAGRPSPPALPGPPASPG